MRLIENYGDKQGFLMRFNPSNQGLIVEDIDNCIKGNYPTLADLNREYGGGMAKAWLIPQLYDLCEYCGVKDKLNEFQYVQLAQVITTEHYYLKVTEFMLFFHRFKSGYYGKFYGVVDPLVITTSINSFIEYRNMRIAKYEQEEAMKRRIAHEEQFPSITYQEYLQLKKQEENGN